MKYLGNFEGGEPHPGKGENTINRKIGNFEGDEPHLGRGGNTINTDTLVNSRVAGPSGQGWEHDK